MSVLNRIKKFIESRSISRYRFWQDTELGRDTAYRLCNDPRYLPSGNVLEKICNTYKVQPGELLEWVPDSDGEPITVQENKQKPLDTKVKTRTSKSQGIRLALVPGIKKESA